MLGRRNNDQAWKPWLRHSKGQNFTKSPRSDEMAENRNHKHGFVLFVRIIIGDKSEMCTLRDLHDGVRVYEIKAKLELISGMPTSVMDMQSLQEKPFQDIEVLIQGKNVSFGDTIRVKTNSRWNELLHAAWKGSLSEVQRYIGLLKKQGRPHSAFPCPEGSKSFDTKSLDSDNLLSEALFISSRKGNEAICKLLLKNGASTTYMTDLGNTSLHTATYSGHLTIVQLLVSHGANVRWKNIHGKSPLDVAVHRGRFDCARWLWLNQWSLAISKDMVHDNERPESQHNDKKSQKRYLTSLNSGNERLPPNLSNSGKTEKLRPTSTVPSNERKSHLQRPYTAHHFRHSSNVPVLADTLRKNRLMTPLQQNNTQDRPFTKPRLTSNGLQSDKSKQILHHLTSKMHRQRSIPANSNDFSGVITNAEMKTPRTQTNKGTAKSSNTRPRSVSFFDKNLCSEDHSDLRQQTPLTSNSSCGVSQNSFSNIKQSAPDESLTNASWLPRTTICSPEVLHPDDFSPLHYDEDRITDVSMLNYTDYRDSDFSDTDTNLQNLSDVKDDKPIGDKIPSPEASRSKNTPFILGNGNESVDERTRSTVSISERNGQLGATESNTDTVKFSPDLLSQASKSPSENQTNIFKEIIMIPKDDETGIIEHDQATEKQQDTKISADAGVSRNGERKDGRVSRSSVRFSEDERLHYDGVFTEPETTKSISPQTIIQPRPRSSKRESKRSSTINTPVSSPQVVKNPEREEKNRKAFEIWLNKKKKAMAKRKDEEAEQMAKLEKKKSLSHKTSMSMTFEEWLQMKEEEEEETGHEEIKQGEKIKKREVKYQKTYEQWILEKGEHTRSEQEKRRCVEIEQKRKEDEEQEKRKKEYERKLEAWLKKKEEMKKNEMERKRRMDEIMIVNAAIMYEEWLSQPRVKSFEEWKNSKDDEIKLNTVSNAQKEVIEKHEREMEEMRQQIAKEKFQQWVFKKDLTKLKDSEIELEKARTKRKSKSRRHASARSMGEEE